jgi:uncharacterized protein (TIGR02099 family)
MILAILIVTAAVISSLFRALTPWATQYKTKVEEHLSVMFGKPVTINTMETGWYWFEPVIKLNQISVLNGKQEVVKLSKLLVGINLLSSLWHWQIRPGILLIDDLHLNLHQKNDRWQIEGIVGNDQKMPLDLATYQPILTWILAQQKIIIKNLSAHLYMHDGTLIPLSELNLTVANRAGHFDVKGRGYLTQTKPTHFQLLANLAVNPYAFDKASGHAFFAVQHLLPAQWQGFVPQSRFHLLGGNADLQLWMDLAKGKLQNAQMKLHFHHLAWLDRLTQKKQLLQSIKANLAWKPTKEGWQLAGDQIQLSLGGIHWPDNTLMLRYQRDERAYFVFIKNILIDSLCSTSFAWPKTMNYLLSMKPKGQLHDTQLQIKNSNLDYFLTRFSSLGWQAQDSLPGVENLAGVFYWQPKSGRLQLFGEQTVVSLKAQVPLTFQELGAVFDWQQANDGLRINLQGLSLEHPNLLLNAQGVIDRISANSKGQLSMTAEFSANNAQQWLTYLPAKHLKPKLDAWLKNNVKRIDKASGNLNVNGPLADFPFDKQPGEFSIKSYLSGVDLVFAHNWPLTKNIAGYLRVDKRTLEVDIVHANLQGVIVEKGNLRINDIGLDKETLLIRSKIESKSNKALAYVLSSPIQKKLSALNMLKMHGLFDLDLRLEVPLYPENDEVLVLGDLNFKDNKVDVRYGLNELQLKELTGCLQFDQKGILDSNLKALVLDYPMNLFIQSIHEPKPHTAVKMEWQTTIESLSKKFNLPLFAVMQGSLGLEGVLKLMDEHTNLDQLEVQSSMKGLSIDLPSPLGKSAETQAPLTAKVDFNLQKKLRLRFNYNNRLKSDLWFSSSKGEIKLQRGGIHLGRGEAFAIKQQGLQIRGSIPYFNLEQWRKTKAKYFNLADNNSFIDAINLVDIKVHEAQIGKEKYKSLAFRATKQNEGQWFINLNQEKLAANLLYQPASHTLTGQVSKLHIEDSNNTNQPASFEHTRVLALSPRDLPNLDLQIASLQWGALDVGEVSLKAKSIANLWQIDYCKIKSPYYQLNAKGEWKQEGAAHSTKIQANLQITDLAKSLQRWKISPAVEARKGDIQFQGGWPGPLPDFVLTKVTGQMAISLRDGRITNLSPEAEGKLGLGKLLSILSLQTIPRRLKLDFSDLSNDGYSFDRLQGNFALANGVMTTQDSYIDGPVAYASMKGSLDIAKQFYDVNLKIIPHITASLPIVATIAGGPVAGAATWVASKLINQGMQKISGYTYKISGPWKQPEVQQGSIIKQ